MCLYFIQLRKIGLKRQTEQRKGRVGDTCKSKVRHFTGTTIFDEVEQTFSGQSVACTVFRCSGQTVRRGVAVTALVSSSAIKYSII